MKIDVCDSKDGSFDATVVLHEYSHGVYGRLTGGPDSSLCSVNDERPTEGVADWLAIMLTMQPGDTESRSRQIGKYFFDQGIDGDGVRNYPYSTDMALNPLTYDSIIEASIPHGVGEVWGTILWEITWELINTHGFNPDLTQYSGNYNQDEGNLMALAIVIEALKLQPCNPGFVDARDAIFAADEVLYQGRNNCTLWKAFARRGLGEDANQGDVNRKWDGDESFKVPNRLANFINGNETMCFDEISIVLGAVTPSGGIFSGTGVTDSGDGETYTFNMAEAGVGMHEVTYSTEAKPCQDASSDTIIIEVLLDLEPPVLNCIEDVEISIPVGEQYSLIDYSFNASYNDNCDTDLNIVQIPEESTLLDFGYHNITFEIEDNSGNKGVCEFILNVRALSGVESFKELFLFPNPTAGDFLIDNTIGLKLTSISYFDISGRLIKTNPLDPNVETISLSIDEFAAGTYFAIIAVGSDSVVKQLIKM